MDDNPYQAPKDLSAPSAVPLGPKRRLWPRLLSAAGGGIVAWATVMFLHTDPDLMVVIPVGPILVGVACGYLACVLLQLRERQAV